MKSWWNPPWREGGSEDPDAGWETPSNERDEHDHWRLTPGIDVSDVGVLEQLEAEVVQVRSRDRVRDLAEVFTHQREVDAILDQIPDAFAQLDIKFLEPSAGSGNFLVEILRRKLRLVRKADCVSQEQYEHRLLRAIASIYGIDISNANITEARARMAHTLLGHYATDANTVEPTGDFLAAAGYILDHNIVVGDTLTQADDIELCDWRPWPGACFQRVWSHSLVPVDERGLLWAERVQDHEPVHYSKLVASADELSTGAVQ